MRCFKKPWRISGITGLIRHVSSFASSGGDENGSFSTWSGGCVSRCALPHSGFDSEDRYRRHAHSLTIEELPMRDPKSGKFRNVVAEKTN
jgi:hypothetical protein